MLLLVDDDPHFLEDAQDRLINGRRGILLAGTAIQAKNLMSTIANQCALAMVDLDLPGEDGFTLIRDLHKRYPEVPIIAISGVYQPDVLESARIFGAVDALHKPITPEWNEAIQRAITPQ